MSPQVMLPWRVPAALFPAIVHETCLFKVTGREASPTCRGSSATQLLAHLPALAEHVCCYGKAGGFVSRMREGTWLGHVAEHAALEHVSSRQRSNIARLSGAEAERS